MDELFYQAVDLLKQLISTPSISRDEAAAADIVEQFINNAGHQTRRHNNNVWTIADDYDPSRPTLLLNSHIDTVKPAPGWQHDPFTPQVDDETFRARQQRCRSVACIASRRLSVHER